MIYIQYFIADCIWILLDSSVGIVATLLTALESQRYNNSKVHYHTCKHSDESQLKLWMIE